VEIFLGLLVRRRTRDRRADQEAPARLSGLGERRHHLPHRRLDALARRPATVEGLHDGGSLLLEVVLDGGEEQRLFRAKRVVEARRADAAHRRQQILERRALVAAIPEQLHRALQRFSPIERRRPPSLRHSVANLTILFGPAASAFCSLG